MTDFIRLDRQQFTDAPQEPWFDELLARINDNTARIPRRAQEGQLEISFGDMVAAHSPVVRFPNVPVPTQVYVEWSESPVTGFTWRGIGDGQVRVNLTTAGRVRLKAKA